MSLPVVYVCENNLYGEFTPWEDVTAGQIAARARGAAASRPRRSTATTCGTVRAAARDAVERGARRRRAAVHRGADLPLRRPLAQRSRAPTASPASSTRGASATRCKVARGRLTDELRRDGRAARRGRHVGRGADRADDRDRARRALPDARRRRASSRSSPAMPELEFRDAVRDALDEELARDDRVIFFGEDVASVQGGVFATTPGLQEKHGQRPRLRHADLRAGDHRRRLRQRGLRPAAGDRDHVRRLPDAVDGQPRQPGGQVLLPVQRAGLGPARRPLGDRRRRALRRDPLADADQLVSQRRRAEDRRAVRRPRTPRRCSRRRSATTTRSCSSSTSACTGSRRTSRPATTWR